MKNYSVAIFGSCLRKDYDKYSDKDLLIVGISFKAINLLKEKYEKDGYSVSTYTYSKLNLLSEKKSLFIEHLKRESSILIDYNNRLKNILAAHKETIPKEKYHRDAKLFFNLLTEIPNTVIGFAWFCDCLYIGLRNYLILESAKNKNYVFSFLSLLNNMKERGNISETEYEILKELRVIKKNYRDRILNELPNKYFISKVIRIARKLNLLTNTTFISKEHFISNIDSKIFSEKFDHYQMLRLVEIYYLLLGVSIDKIDRIICNPQFYANNFKNHKYIDSLLKEIQIKKQYRTKAFNATQSW